MKTWEIYHYTYGNVCSDDWFGKESRYRNIGYVTDTEENVKEFVNKLNTQNHTYHACKEPRDEFDEDYEDEDYYDYKELRVNTIEELEDWCKRSRYLKE